MDNWSVRGKDKNKHFREAADSGIKMGRELTVNKNTFNNSEIISE